MLSCRHNCHSYLQRPQPMNDFLKLSPAEAPAAKSRKDAVLADDAALWTAARVEGPHADGLVNQAGNECAAANRIEVRERLAISPPPLQPILLPLFLAYQQAGITVGQQLVDDAWLILHHWLE